MIFSIHQPHYLPWLGYFNKILNSDLFIILDNVQFVKREYQNRNKIKTPNGAKWLTVPVITKGRYFQKISEVEIDNSKNWRISHLDLIKQSYKSSPYFNYFFPKLKKNIEKKYNKLCDLNINMLKFYLEELEIDTPIKIESDFEITTVSTNRIVDLSNKCGINTYYSGIGGKNYMDMDKFKENNIKVIFQNFKHPTYNQLFGEFVPYMSVIDLIFNEGKNSREIIKSGERFG